MDNLKTKIIDFMINYDREHFSISKNKLETIKDDIITKLNIKEDKYKFKCSTGVGAKANIPWICIFDKNITKNAQKGVYIAILFRADMKGFFISLNQGYTHINETYKKKNDIEIAAYKISEYYRDILKADKMSISIDLKSDFRNNNLARGYEWCNIYSHYIDIEEVKDYPIVILERLELFMRLYDEFMAYNKKKDYYRIAENIFDLSDILYDPHTKNDYLESIIKIKQGVKLIETTETPSQVLKSTKKNVGKALKFSGISDNQKKEIGDIGENHVINFEKERLKGILDDNKIECISHVSKFDDTAGYDIKSFDENGEDIYIEVKTTTSKINMPFFFSANEYKKMHELRDKYFIYRVFNIKEQPTLYIIKYEEINKLSFETDVYKVNYLK